MVGLPGIPTEEELSKLQENRQKEASLRVEEEKRQKARAQIKFDSSAKKQQRSGSEEGIRQSRSIQPVKFDNGFVSSLRYGPIGHQSYTNIFPRLSKRIGWDIDLVVVLLNGLAILTESELKTGLKLTEPEKFLLNLDWKFT